MELREGERMLQLASLKVCYFVSIVNEPSRKFGFCFDDDMEEFDEWIDTLLLKDVTEEEAMRKDNTFKGRETKIFMNKCLLVLPFYT